MRKTDSVAVVLRKKKRMIRLLKTIADGGKKEAEKVESGVREKRAYVIKVNFQLESIHHVDDTFNSQ